MQHKSVTEERAETWKANERVVVAKKIKFAARFWEFFYVFNIFLAAIDLMAGSMFFGLLAFLNATVTRHWMFQELRGCSA